MIFLNSNRRETINSYIQENGTIKLKDLENIFPNLSSMTLRRDLEFLEKNGNIIRIRGGAKSLNSFPKSKEDVYSQRAMENISAKVKIAKKALEYIGSRRSIYLDSGTTMMCFARELPDEDLSILTSGPSIGLEILKNNRPSVTILGGRISRNTLSASGSNSLGFLKEVNIDIAFMAASGFSLEHGFTSGDYYECELKKAVIKKAGKVIMLMDVSKINKNMLFTFATLKDIDVLISDDELDDTINKAAAKHGVKIV